MARREYQGGAVATTITGGITNASTSLVLTVATGWPTGSFSAVLDKGLSGEEKILCTSRSGTTVTITTRGYDGTSASSHTSGATISPCLTAIDLDEANLLVSGITAGTGIAMAGSTSGSTLLKSTAVAGSTTVTIPAATDTLVGKATTDTLTNKTLTSPIITGLTLNDSSIVFEGATADAFETTLTVTDPTADRTITLPDLNGTIALTDGYTSTATAAGTTVLTVASTKRQVFTGTLAQTVTMPLVSTLPELGYPYHIINDSTGIVTVNSSGGNLIYAIPAGVTVDFICTLLAGTTAASWLADYPAAASAGSLVLVKARTTFTGVADTGTTFDSIFTSTYKNYMVIIDGWIAGATDDPQMQMLYSGATEATGYYGSSSGTNWGVAGLVAQGNNNATQMTFWGNIGNTNGTALTLYFSRVGQGSDKAMWRGFGYEGDNADQYSTGGVATVSRAYTGFKLKSSVGNITGSVTVYGLAAA